MAELKVKISGDARDAVQAAQSARQQIVEQFAQAGREVSQQEIAPDFDTVFRQLTQFRIGLTQIARGDLGGIPNLITGIALAGQQVADIAPKIATSAQAFKILDTALQASGFKAVTAKSLFEEFQASVKTAATGTGAEAQRLRKEFEAFGVNVTQALAKPEQAFVSFLRKLETAKGLKSLESLNIGNEKLVGTISRASASLVEFEAAETAAAASGVALAGGLSAATLGIGAIALAALAAVAAMVKLGLSLKDLTNDAQRFADDLGLSVDQVRLLQVASTAANVEFGKVAQTFQQFQEQTNKALNETGEGADKVRRLFVALGVDVKRAATNPLTTYEQLVRSISSLTDASTRAAASKELLGARTEDVARLFALLSANGGELRDELNRMLGTTQSSEQAVSDYNVAVARLSASWQGFLTTMGPVLRVLSLVLDFLTASQQAAEEFGKALRSTFEELRGNDEFFPGGVDFKEFSDFADQEDKKTSKVKDALRERRKITRQARDEAAREDLRELENQLRTLDAEYRLSNTRLRQALDERLINEQTYTEKLVAIAEERKRLAEEILQAEETRVRNSRLRPEEQTRELQRIARERANLERETAAEIERIQFDARQRDQQLTERFQQEILRTLELTNQRKLALIEDQIDREILTNEEGQARINEIILDGLRQRIAAQQAIVNTFPQGSQQAILEAERLKQLQIELGKAEEDALIQSRNARQRDLQTRRQYLSDLQQIQNDIAEEQVRQLELAANTGGRDAALIALQARAEVERQIALEQSNQRINALEQQLEFNRAIVASDAAVAQTKLANEQRLTELLQAEYERRQEVLRTINQQQAQDTQRLNKTLGDALKNGRDAVRQNATAMVGAFITGQASARQAAQAFYDSLTGPLADYLVEEGIAQSVLAVKDLANLNFAGAALHAAAAAALFGGAFLIGKGSRAIGGTPGGGGTSSLGQSLTGTRQDQNTISTDNRFRYFEGGRIVTEIRIVTDQEQMVKNVSTSLVRDYNQGGMTRKIIRKETAGEPIYP
jgi:hypothetical protein